MNIIIPSLFAILLALFGCNSNHVSDSTNDLQAEEQEQAAESSETPLDVEALLNREAQIVAGAPGPINNKMAFDLFSELKDTENLTFSPFSISLALAMTYAGSNTDSESAMKTVLGFGDNNDSFHQRFGDFANLLRNKPRSTETTIKISNVQWIDQAFSVLPSYAETLEKNYAARPIKLDFKRDAKAATQKINGVIAEQTNNEISQLFKSDLPDSTRLVLTNAIYFKSEWKSKFPPYQTEPGEFQQKDGSKSNANYMKQVTNLPYSEDDTKQVLLMPYGDEDFAAVFILPKEGKQAALDEALSPETLSNAMDALTSTRVSVWLPKFSQRSSPDLKNVLTHLGLGIIFDPSKADLSRIHDADKERLFVENIAHEAVVKMYEEGTTAAAATGISVGATAVMPTPEDVKEFHATRPFYFFLLHAPTKTILFMGRVDRPQE